MTDRLADIGTEFRALRAESTRLKRRTANVRDRLQELRPILAAVIVEELAKDRPVQEISRLTGYDRDSIRKIRIAVEQAKGKQESPE